MRFAGPCPFLTCLVDGPHEHAVCHVCDTVRHSNLTCSTCLSHQPPYPHVVTIHLLQRRN